VFIEELHRRLLETARQRIRAGEVTERKLARLCGLSQPHLHNVLKEIRSLSTESADRLMRALNLTVVELLWRTPEIDGAIRAIPIVRNRIGPGTEIGLTNFRGFVPFRESQLRSLVDPVLARLAADLAMPKAFAPNDLVLLDQNPEVRRHPSGTLSWVVATDMGLRVRYVRLGGTKVYLPSEATVDDPPRWEAVSLHGRDILDIVRARIVWISREMEAPQAGSHGPFSLGY
jgi:hypothetical protein